VVSLAPGVLFFPQGRYFDHEAVTARGGADGGPISNSLWWLLLRMLRGWRLFHTPDGQVVLDVLQRDMSMFTITVPPKIMRIFLMIETISMSLYIRGVSFVPHSLVFSHTQHTHTGSSFHPACKRT